MPEFLLRKLYVPGSLKILPSGFDFELNNAFAPATVTGFQVDVDGQPVPPGQLWFQSGSSAPHSAAAITPETPVAMSVGVVYTVHVEGVAIGQGRLTLSVDTREVGLLRFSLHPQERAARAAERPVWRRPRLFSRPLKAEVVVESALVTGVISPYLYGHFVEHMERVIYGGLWTDDGTRWRPDTLALVKRLRPPVIRYPGGNFASGYHWEDGIGPRAARPRRFDEAWHSWETNAVGTDEFLAYCAALGADPYLVVNDGSGTPDEAARWVAYCNEPETGPQGRRRALNGHPATYGVRLWGVGNEVWANWQIGHTGPAEYAARLRKFARTMRAADPKIQIVGVGDKVASDAPSEAGWLWNETVLRLAGDVMDYFSFHFYQPGLGGWQETYDPEALYYTVCAGPLDAEDIIQRLSRQIAEWAPDRNIRLALDEWNLWLAPPPHARSRHQNNYTLRDAVYTAGMLNVFHRQSAKLSLANLAQLVNVLPAIITGRHQAYVTPVFLAFELYRAMQRLALQVETHVATFNNEGLGSVASHRNVPYLDVTATRDEQGRQVTLGLVNRHPVQRVQTQIELRGPSQLRLGPAWQLAGTDPDAMNTMEAPERVHIRTLPRPRLSSNQLQIDLPPTSVTVVTLTAG
jgi:alpha-N-arabinofuranosidase